MSFCRDEYVVLIETELDSRLCKVFSNINDCVSAKPIDYYRTRLSGKRVFINGVFLASSSRWRYATDDEIVSGRRS